MDENESTVYVKKSMQGRLRKVVSRTREQGADGYVHHLFRLECGHVLDLNSRDALSTKKGLRRCSECDVNRPGVFDRRTMHGPLRRIDTREIVMIDGVKANRYRLECGHEMTIRKARDHRLAKKRKSMRCTRCAAEIA